MDDLSPKAAAFLRQARRGQELPGADVVARVRAKVDLSLGAELAAGEAAAGKAAAGKAAAGKFGSALTKSAGGAGTLAKGAAVKLGAGAAALVIAGSGVWLSREAAKSNVADQASQLPHRSARFASGLPGDAPTATSYGSGAAPSGDVSADLSGGVAADPLRDELALLQRASAALDAGDGHLCLELLRAHRAQFPHAALVEERESLSLLARCLDAPRGLRAEAEVFLIKHPNALLGARIRKACKLTGP